MNFYTFRIIFPFLLVFTSLGLSAQCVSGSSGNQPDEEYTLVWSDEFSDDGAVCSENWFHQTKLPNGQSWYNGELQHYTDDLANASVSNGSLKITAIREQYTNQGVTKPFSSARLNSRFVITYGRIDVKAKLPAGSGTWPAIWMLGQNITEPGGYWTETYGTTPWPATGEIDIMEHWGNNPNIIHGSLHTTSSHGATVNTGKTNIPNVSTEFHVYSTIWDSDKIQFLVNDVVYYTYQPTNKTAATWPFDNPQYMLLNIAMGGIGGNVDPNFTSSSMEIDYIRVYQKEGSFFMTDAEEIVVSSPLTIADEPIESASNVVSLFGDSYENKAVDEWLAQGSDANYEVVDIDGREVIKYSNLSSARIEMTSNPINIAGFTHLHMDMWTTSSSLLKIKLVDYGQNGFSSGSPNDDSEDEISLGSQQTSQWVSLEIPISDFTQLTGKTNLAEIMISSMPSANSIYLDNIYFFNPNGALAVVDEKHQTSFHLSDETLKATFNQPRKITNYQVFDLMGKVLLSGRGEDHPVTSFEIAIKPSGIQILRIETNQGIVAHKFLF
ncbi:MAG: glycoside hydrolase family 16 protein [Cyclobacteriaceae bacterium]